MISRLRKSLDCHIVVTCLLNILYKFNTRIIITKCERGWLGVTRFLNTARTMKLLMDRCDLLRLLQATYKTLTQPLLGRLRLGLPLVLSRIASHDLYLIGCELR